VAKVNIYLPDAVYEGAIAADVNLSGTLRKALESQLTAREECAHPRHICADCGAELPPT
jgi:post-segregation antitoxin (ccd killing protein)